ncbi:MAG: hypothetical protein RL322_2121 [Pseudomonadota bacterium]|jgi:phosphatidylethanolamine/phosphatidyl-N-methylethanolamine N-methyltransferase
MNHHWLFFKRWLTHPLQMGSIVPTSVTASRLLAHQVQHVQAGHIIEAGAGTGVVSQALLDAGVAPERLTLLEIDPELAQVLARRFPGVEVVHGDALDLASNIRPELHGAIGQIICGIPLLLLPFGAQRRFVDSVEQVAPGQGFLQLSYQITSPLPAERLGLQASRVGWTWRNIPPAHVWRYQPAQRASLTTS